MKKADVSVVFEKGKKENTESYRLFSFNLIPGNMMKQIILETISKKMKDKKGVVCIDS